MKQFADLAKRFWKKVAKSDDGCWLWCAGVDSCGYGKISVGGSKNERHLKAPRVAWELVNGPIPEKAHVLHTCDVRRCVRPDHLYLGDHKHNMRDRKDRGRSAVNKKGGRRKLSESDVAEMRSRNAFGESVQKLADEFLVNKSTAYKAIVGITWADVAGALTEAVWK